LQLDQVGKDARLAWNGEKVPLRDSWVLLGYAAVNRTLQRLH